MPALAFIEGLFSPTHLLCMFAALCAIGGFVWLIVWAARKSNPPPSALDRELERRRRALEVEKLELDIEEHKRRREQPPPLP